MNNDSKGFELKRTFFLVGCVIVGVMCAGCGEAPQVEPEELIRPVRSQLVFLTGSDQVRTFSGTARAGLEAKLSFKVSGTLQRLLVKVGDKVYFHVTNLEQDYDVPHGVAMIGAQTSELLIMPGQTETFVWYPKRVGVWPFYCTDFCSALHQEMQGYIRVSPASSDIELSWSLGED